MSDAAPARKALLARLIPAQSDCLVYPLQLTVNRQSLQILAQAVS